MIDFKNKSVENEVKKFAKMTSNQKLDNLNLNADGFKMAIKRATRDLTTRTLKNISKNKDESLVDTLVKDSGDSFLNNIVNYFNADPKGEDEFDEWHNKICEKLLDIINIFYCNPDGTKVCYGKAQKILNMTLKSCYCLNGANKKAEHFKYCHVPLDSFTLEWFYRDVVQWFNKNNKCNITKGRICSWSVIQNKHLEGNRTVRTKCYNEDTKNRVFDIESNSFYHYTFIQDIIRNYFDENSKEEVKITPLQAEFIIWPEIQLHLSAEALFGQSIGQDEMIERIQQIQQENNEDALKKIRDEISKREQQGKKITKTQTAKKEKLTKKIDSMEEANKIYKELPLKTKIDLLSEKIELLKNYCTD